MAYNENIPQPTDQLKNSQQDLLDNFQALKQLIDVNHATFGSADEGQHKFITFPVQGAAPAFGAGDIGLFSKLPAAPFPLTGVNELFITNSAGTTTPLSASEQAASGWSYLPSGVLLKWGNFATVPGNNVLNFPVAGNIPAFSSIFQVIIATTGIAAADVFVTLVSFNTTSMTVYSTERTTTNTAVASFRYLAIGA